MIYINIFRDTDGLNDDYYLLTTENVSKLIDDIECCFVSDDSNTTICNLIKCKADNRLIDFARKTLTDYCSVYEFTYDVLAYCGVLLKHTNCYHNY